MPKSEQPSHTARTTVGRDRSEIEEHGNIIRWLYSKEGLCQQIYMLTESERRKKPIAF